MQRLGGVGHIFTCTETNVHPIFKPFEMGTYWNVIKPPIFLFDHRMCESWDFGQFSKNVWQKWALEVAESAKKKFQKIRKNDENFFSFILFVLRSIECIVSSRLDTMTIKPFLLPLYSQTARQITFSKWWENLWKSSKSQKMSKSFFCVLFSLEVVQNSLVWIPWWKKLSKFQRWGNEQLLFCTLWLHFK